MAGTFFSADIGTSSLKAAFIDGEGRLKAYSRVPYPRDSPDGALLWERAFASALESLYAEAPDSLPDAICISGNGPTLVPVTEAGEDLPPLYWYDGRTALPPPTLRASAPRSFFLPRAAWLKQNSPEQYGKTRFFLSSHEWLSHRLGAEALTVLPSPSYEPYYWDEEQCRLFGLEREKFPPFILAGRVCGRLSREAASRLAPYCGGRLKSGTPIISGGPDFITALIGTKTRKAGDVCDRAGSSEGINVCAPSEYAERQKFSAGGEGIRLLPHAEEGLFNAGVVIKESGRLIEKYGDAGEVLCAIGFAVRSALETLENTGLRVESMTVSGGQGRNPRWNQLKADISGRVLVIPEIPDAELMGNAVLSASALAEAPRGEFAERMIRFREVYEPERSAAPLWDERYARYLAEMKGEER